MSGRGTELITILMNSGSKVPLFASELREEISSASNIKSDRLRNNVKSALNKCLRGLQQYRTIPKNGLAIFASADKITIIEPPIQLPIHLYRCDNRYHTEWLLDSLEPHQTMGLIAMDTKDAGFGYLQGNQLRVLTSITSGIHGKSKKGGQSQRRYEREREMYLNDFYHRIADYARTYFLDNMQVKEIYILSPAFTKHDFMSGNYLEYRLQGKVTKLIDGCYAGEEGLYELFNRVNSNEYNK